MLAEPVFLKDVAKKKKGKKNTQTHRIRLWTVVVGWDNYSVGNLNIFDLYVSTSIFVENILITRGSINGIVLNVLNRVNGESLYYSIWIIACITLKKKEKRPKMVCMIRNGFQILILFRNLFAPATSSQMKMRNAVSWLK